MNPEQLIGLENDVDYVFHCFALFLYFLSDPNSTQEDLQNSAGWHKETMRTSIFFT